MNYYYDEEDDEEVCEHDISLDKYCLICSSLGEDFDDLYNP